MAEFRFTKWGGSPHWTFPADLLGADELGTWFHVPLGAFYSRPGMEFTADYPALVLVPEGRGYVAAWNAPGHPTAVYVDISTVPTIADGVVCAVDLDLDVVRRANGRVYVDDEDEFQQHQVELGYPPEIVDAARDSCRHVLRLVRSRSAPFDDATPARWWALSA